MQIELVGCTGAGKSTLASEILCACKEQGFDIFMSKEFVLRTIRLNWIKTEIARIFLVDIMSLVAILVTWRENIKFYRLMTRTIQQLPDDIPRLQKLNTARNALKMIGIYEIVRHSKSDQEIVLADEGTLQTAHYLFVQVSDQPKPSDLSTFIKSVPLPDAIIWVQQDEHVLIERTMERGHKRIPSGSRADVEVFISRAVATFDELARNLVVQGKLDLVNRECNIFISRDRQNQPLLAQTLRIIGKVIGAINLSNRTRISPS